MRCLCHGSRDKNPRPSPSFWHTPSDQKLEAGRPGNETIFTIIPTKFTLMKMLLLSIHTMRTSQTSPIVVETSATSDQQVSKGDPYDAYLARLFVPVAAPSMTEQGAVNNLFNNTSLIIVQLPLLQQSCGQCKQSVLQCKHHSQ